MQEVYDATQAEFALGVSKRQLQNYARDGKIRFTAIQMGCVQKRLYNGEDVERLKSEKKNFKPLTKAPEARTSTEIVPIAKPSQELRALDTVSIVGQIVAAHKGELEMLFSTALAFLKSEADANRERLKAEREDARERFEAIEKRRAAERKDDRERWELERQDKQARLDIRRGGKSNSRKPETEKASEPSSKLNGKAKGAHA